MQTSAFSHTTTELLLLRNQQNKFVIKNSAKTEVFIDFG
jgi:hypothetical protein